MKDFFLLTILVCFGLLSNSLYAQTPINWDLLAEIEIENKHDEKAKAYYSQIIPSENVQALNQKRVKIKGFILPMDVKDGYYILSAFPNSSCFFCGGAGEESVIELKFKDEPKTYKMDDVVTFEGIFRWNSKPFELPYVMEEVEQVE